VEVDHVSEGTISKGRAVDRNIVLPAPVIDTLLVVDLLTDSGYNFLRREYSSLLLLLLVHLLHHR